MLLSILLLMIALVLFAITFVNFSVKSKHFERLDKKYKNLQKKYGRILNEEEILYQIRNDIKSSQGLQSTLKNQISHFQHNIEHLQQKISELEEEDFIQSHGFYQSKYDFGSSQKYKIRLDAVKEQQKDMIRDKMAAICHTDWTVDGSKQQGKKFITSYLKLILRAFNGECDTAVMKVKYNNIKTLEKRILKAQESLNKLAAYNHCEITYDYLKLKLEELYLTHEFKEKQQEEKEEQKRIKEQMRQEELAQREIDKAKKEAEKEEKQYQLALEKAREEVEKSAGKRKEKLEEKISELVKRLEEAQTNKERAVSRAQLTKSGHVYIISNIGAFGDNIYKIGMTRRLEPLDRIKELSNASVPFPFDVHAMVFSENAPELENQLHRALDTKRVNKVNTRKEFFRVSLQEIAQALHHIVKNEELNIKTANLKITKIAEAEEYRKTQSIPKIEE